MWRDLFDLQVAAGETELRALGQANTLDLAVS
jgi:hypothetical protein